MEKKGGRYKKDMITNGLGSLKPWGVGNIKNLERFILESKRDQISKKNEKTRLEM